MGRWVYAVQSKLHNLNSLRPITHLVDATPGYRRPHRVK